VLPRVADDQRFLDRLSLYDYDLPFIAVPLMGPHSRPIGVLAAQPMARQEERLPACTRFLETVANLVAQTIRLMILPTSAAQPPQQSPELSARAPVPLRAVSAWRIWSAKARRCGRLWTLSVRSPAGIPRCWYAARAAPGKS
jgi:hypothetical protein